MIPDNIFKEHIVKAIEEIDRDGVRKGRHSSTYDLVYNGKPYPPKLVLSIANKYANNTELDPNDFEGGKGTDAFKLLKKEGFEIIPKNNKNNMTLIDKYLNEFAEKADDWFKEQTWLQERYDYYQKFFKIDYINNAQWSDFQELGNQIHSFNMALAKKRALGDMNQPIEEYRRVFKYVISEEDPINTTINNLYKKYDGKAVLPFFSDSSISELISYAFPHKYVLYNRRDVNALKILGLELPKIYGEKFGDQFLRYNKLITPLISRYEEIVGKRTNTSIHLELDQFFSWLYENKKADLPIKDLINQYKTILKTKGLDQEKYKWEIIRDYKGKPDITSKDFKNEIHQLKLDNLVYYMSRMIKGIVDYDEEKTRQLFKDLINKDQPLNDRIIAFEKNTTKVLKEFDSKNVSGQDERTISAYLTLHNPEQYTFYKDSYYKAYCKLIGEKPHKKNQKYEHYLELLNDLVDGYIISDSELLELAKDNLGDLFDLDPNNLLLGQDILYQVLDANRSVEYWIFQGNPKVYDIVSALNDSAINTWSVKAHKDKIKKGDKIILWVTGDNSGCYGLGEVTSEVYNDLDDDDQNKYYTDYSSNEKSDRVSIKIEKNLSSSPITKAQIDSIDELSKLKIGNQGTNFSATKEEYETLLEIANSNNVSEGKIEYNRKTMNYPLNTIFYGPPGTGKTYNTVKRAAEIIENREIKSYDEALEIFKANLHNQIEFITFHQNYSYEDFIQGLRPDTENNNELTFERKDGVFKVIADRALLNYKESEKAPEDISQVNAFSEALEILKDKILESEVPVRINDTAYFTAVEDDAFRYSGDNWTLNDKGFNGFRMKYSDLERFLEEDVKQRKEIKNLKNISGLAKQHATYFIKAYELVKSMMSKTTKKVEAKPRKNYVIIIDEINRANISRVFGELITLIEPDKRSHGNIPMEAKLPSGDTFIVPSNLYIIGTMNTADKSIALLDIALRRRFVFEAMYPEYYIEGQEIYDVEILEKINKEIIDSKGHDFQIGHAYFMGENKDLATRMNKKVIPLLLEYYMNDEKEVKSILQSSGLEIEENSWPLRITDK